MLETVEKMGKLSFLVDLNGRREGLSRSTHSTVDNRVVVVVVVVVEVVVVVVVAAVASGVDSNTK